MRHPAVVLVGLALLAIGCNRGSNEPASDKASPAASVAAPAASPQPKGPDVSNALTEEDFEEEAERQITADNIEAELDALSREISQK
jgi:hypothetical protein